MAAAYAIFPHMVEPFYPRINFVVEYPREQLVYYGQELNIKDVR